MLAVYRSVLADLPLGISPSKYHFHSVITIGVWALVGCFFSLVSQITSLSVYSVYGWEEACEKDLCSLLLVSPLWSWFCQFCLESSSFLHQSLDCTDCHYLFVHLTNPWTCSVLVLWHQIIQAPEQELRSTISRNGRNSAHTFQVDKTNTFFKKKFYWIFSLLIFQMSSPFQVPPPKPPYPFPSPLLLWWCFPTHPVSREQGRDSGQGWFFFLLPILQAKDV